MSKYKKLYQDQPWYKRVLISLRHDIFIPTRAIKIWWYERKDKDNEWRLDFAGCWDLAIGLSQVDKNYLLTWDEVSKDLGFPDLTETRCEDCNIVTDYDPEHEKDHPGQCCDCFDMLWGMPSYYRSKLLPDATDDDKKKHAEYWANIAERKKRKKDKLN